MAPRFPKKPQTEGVLHFDPDQFFEDWEKNSESLAQDNDLQKCIQKAFGLSINDKYIYRAVAEVTLAEAQEYLNHGDQGRLLEWYRNADGSKKDPPPKDDISSYTSIFSPLTNTSKSLTSFSANAKRLSLRFDVSKHLLSLYSPSPLSSLSTPKLKPGRKHLNPYLDVFSWSSQALQWCGPDDETRNTRISHGVLPVLYHHFGCVCPSYEALNLILALASDDTKGNRTVIDLGSGGGYWTYMLRRLILQRKNDRKPTKKNDGEEGMGREVEVVAVDSAHSSWRTVWIPDTVVVDGVKFLEGRGGEDTNATISVDNGSSGNDNTGEKMGDGEGVENSCSDVLLLVYPQVGADFTGRILRAYKGDTIIVAGTQNANGYTGFSDETVSEWMEREMPAFKKLFQIPLPSFPGKDEALFAFKR